MKISAIGFNKPCQLGNNSKSLCSNPQSEISQRVGSGIYPSQSLSKVYFCANILNPTKSLIEELSPKPISVVNAKKDFIKLFSHTPEVASWAPGRLEGMGNHIDNYGGIVLGIPINAGTLVIAGKAKNEGSRIVRVFSQTNKFAETLEFDLGKEIPMSGLEKHFKTKEGKWVDYVESTFRVLQDHLGAKLPGMDLVINQNIPSTGLSTSSSLELAVAQSVLGLVGKKIDGEELAKLCKKAENIKGVGCGILDQGTIGAAKEANQAVVIDCREPVEFEKIPFNIAGHQIVVVPSGANHANTTFYDNFGIDYKEGAKRLIKGFFPDKNYLCEIKPEEYIPKRSEIIESGTLTEAMLNKCEHGIMENKRVIDAIKSLRKGDVVHYSNLLTQSHHSSRDLLGVSCDELDYVHNLGLNSGALGGRLSGAGRGGSVYFVVPDEKLEGLVKAMKAQHHPNGQEAGIFVFKPAGGARVLDKSVKEI